LRTFNYFAIILFQIGYTFSFIKFPSWLFLISGTRLEMLNCDDFAKIELNKGTKNKFNRQVYTFLKLKIMALFGYLPPFSFSFLQKKYTWVKVSMSRATSFSN